MKKCILIMSLVLLFLGVAAVGYCAEPVSFEKGDFTIDGITVGDNIKTIIAKKGKPDVSHKPDKNTGIYQYTNRYTLMTKGDGTMWYIATSAMPTARGIKPGMSKQQMIDAYGDKYEFVETAKSFNYEYLGENTKLVFLINGSGVILQIDCRRYK